MAYENRAVQAVIDNSLPTGTDPVVDNTSMGDVQAIKLLDATPGSTTPLVGQMARTLSVPVTLSAEDVLLIDGIEAALAGLGTQTTLAAILSALSGGLAIGGNVEVVNDVGNPLPISSTALTTIAAGTPALGPAVAAASTPVTLANDGVFANNFGLQADAVATTDTGTFSFVALFKRLVAKFATAAALADAAANPTTTTVGAALLGWNGAAWDRVRVQSFRVDMSAVTITTIATVWTPTSGKKFVLMGGSFSVSAAVSVLFEDNAAGAGNFVWRTPKLAVDTPYNFDLGNGKAGAANNNVLKATASAAATITGTLYGVEI